tara:strand:- start:1481 stop:1786 length:306 start_codon:yes stop_codon:yes gene_type:complete
MSYDISDSQREILGRTLKPAEIDNYVRSVWDAAEAIAEGTGDAAVETKISLISEMPPHAYDEMRRRAYPAIGDQLDDLYKQGAFSDDMAAALLAVKQTHPK